jgi:hypothetical protein
VTRAIPVMMNKVFFEMQKNSFSRTTAWMQEVEQRREQLPKDAKARRNPGTNATEGTELTEYGNNINKNIYYSKTDTRDSLVLNGRNPLLCALCALCGKGLFFFSSRLCVFARDDFFMTGTR